MASRNAKSKVLAASLFTVCASAVGIMGVYLPFHSQASLNGQEARRQLHEHKVANPTDQISSSVWKNIQNQKETTATTKNEE